MFLSSRLAFSVVLPSFTAVFDVPGLWEKESKNQVITKWNINHISNLLKAEKE